MAASVSVINCWRSPPAAKTYKLKFGHRGSNHPVIDCRTSLVQITAHNHGFSVDADSLTHSSVEITHVNLNDNTVEGLALRDVPAIAVQYHPEASPGPHDALPFFRPASPTLMHNWREEHAMPKRTDLNRILVIGSGPIVIGQACEFDYSGTQAIKALRAEGIEVMLVNSNPATIMTDPDLADRTYIEPLTVPFVEKIIQRDRPDAILPSVGGQTALNLALALQKAGVLDKYQRKADRRVGRGDPTRRRSRTVQAGDDRDRS